jgi:hypothetical protein
MAKQKYDYEWSLIRIDPLRPPEWNRKVRRILRKLVREAVMLALNDAVAVPSKTGPEHADDIAKWLIP